jgi:hypothetical protein
VMALAIAVTASKSDGPFIDADEDPRIGTIHEIVDQEYSSDSPFTNIVDFATGYR